MAEGTGSDTPVRTAGPWPGTAGMLLPDVQLGRNCKNSARRNTAVFKQRQLLDDYAPPARRARLWRNPTTITVTKAPRTSTITVIRKWKFLCT